MDILLDFSLLVMLGFSALAYWAGYKAGIKVHKVNEETPVIKKAKIHRTTYRAGDLLDPISPADQRLEKSLEVKSKEDELDGE